MQLIKLEADSLSSYESRKKKSFDAPTEQSPKTDFVRFTFNNIGLFARNGKELRRRRRMRGRMRLRCRHVTYDSFELVNVEVRT